MALTRLQNKKCLECGSDFIVKNCYVDERKFCSHLCYGKSKIGKPNVKKGRKFPHLGGENHWNWMSDRSKLAKSQNRNDSAYKDWRRNVWKRDNFKCKIQDHNCSGKIEAHHILGWKDYPELRYEINNGITLCHAHHPLKRAEEKRLSPFFQELVRITS